MCDYYYENHLNLRIFILLIAIFPTIICKLLVSTHALTNSLKMNSVFINVNNDDHDTIDTNLKRIPVMFAELLRHP